LKSGAEPQVLSRKTSADTASIPPIVFSTAWKAANFGPRDAERAARALLQERVTP
jgi:hypothetical protein